MAINLSPQLGTALCSLVRHFTLTLPLSNQVYENGTSGINGGSNPAMDYHPILLGGSRKKYSQTLIKQPPIKRPPPIRPPVIKVPKLFSVLLFDCKINKTFI